MWEFQYVREGFTFFHQKKMPSGGMPEGLFTVLLLQDYSLHLFLEKIDYGLTLYGVPTASLENSAGESS